MKLINWLKNFRYSTKFAFLAGLAATLWFLLRVIPKPSRARYPCMQAAAPLMSSFIIYLLGVGTTVFSWKKFRYHVKSSRYLIAMIFLAVSLGSFGFILLKDNHESLAAAVFGLDETFPVASNDPVGEAKGLFPGRVVWVHDPDATNENYNPSTAGNDWWYSNNNANQEVINNMLNYAIRKYADADNISDAWNLVFTAFNESHGRGSVGYTPGEKIAVKINLTNQCCSSAARMDATPQLINALLHELTVNVGVNQADIILGDPYRDFRQEYVNLVKSQYPNVKYTDGDGGNGVYQTAPTSAEVLVFSNKNEKSTLPSQYEIAPYFINIPCLKTHNEGGITLIAKNHQGSFLPKGMSPSGQSAMAMHPYLPGNSHGRGQYRHLVDYMGHEFTGGKGLIYIIDGIWGGENWEGWIKKFKSAPFNNDYPNSIFVGQDPVALESVGFDILFEEYVQDGSKQPYPITMKEEIADYLLQCASSDYWPEGITYDPEGDGSAMGSLGVFEHWNNATDRQYTRNLGTGNGVELNYYQVSTVGIADYTAENEIKASPNPFSDYITFTLSGKMTENMSIRIYNLNGQMLNELKFSGSNQLTWYGTDIQGRSLSNGTYIYTISGVNESEYPGGKIVLNSN